MITFLRGISGSGKSTWAKEQLAQNPKKTIIISRDAIREELLGDRLADYFAQGMNHNLEEHITRIEHARFMKAAHDDMCIYNYDRNIIIDNTNLRRRWINNFVQVLGELNYPSEYVELKDFEISVRDAFERCQKRDKTKIALEVIEEQYNTLQKEKWCVEDYLEPIYSDTEWNYKTSVKFQLPSFPIIPNKPNDNLPKALICDLDGTLAHRAILFEPFIHMRGWYDDEQEVATDEFDEMVLCTIQALADKGYQILFVSGRKEQARQATEQWLETRLGRPYKLFMRNPEKDTHDGYHDADDKVKYRIFNENIRNNYDVRAVFDDRKRVIAMWEALGLKVFNVGELNDVF